MKSGLAELGNLSFGEIWLPPQNARTRVRLLYFQDSFLSSNKLPGGGGMAGLIEIKANSASQ